MPEVLVAHREVLGRMTPGRVAALLAGWIDAVEWCKDPQCGREFAHLCTTKVFTEEKLALDEIPELLKNVRIHGSQELRERNLQEPGITTFLKECANFTGRAGRFDVARMFDKRPLERALELQKQAPVAAPAK